MSSWNISVITYTKQQKKIRQILFSPNYTYIKHYEDQTIQICYQLHIEIKDIKPENILVDRFTLRVVICDLWICQKIIQRLTQYSIYMFQMMPSTITDFGATQYTGQIDMWSMGCVIVQMINGQAPFLGDQQIKQLLWIMKILGTPQKSDMQQMNPKYDMQQYKKYPTFKKNALKKNPQNK